MLYDHGDIGGQVIEEKANSWCLQSWWLGNTAVFPMTRIWKLRGLPGYQGIRAWQRTGVFTTILLSNTLIYKLLGTTTIPTLLFACFTSHMHWIGQYARNARLAAHG